MCTSKPPPSSSVKVAVAGWWQWHIINDNDTITHYTNTFLLFWVANEKGRVVEEEKIYYKGYV